MSFLTKTSAIAIAASVSAMAFAGGPVPMAHNDHDGFGVTMGIGADNTKPYAGAGFDLGLSYAQSMFKGTLLVGATGFGSNVSGSSTQWFIPVTLGLGVRYGLTDNLYGTLSAVGNVTFLTKKATNYGNAWSVAAALGLDYYLSDSLYVTGYVTPFAYGQQKQDNGSGAQVTVKGYSIFTSGFLGLTYNFNL